jgi:Flp pilus assembly protein TadD
MSIVVGASRALIWIVAGVLALGLAGCESDSVLLSVFKPVPAPAPPTETPPTTPTVEQPADVQYYPSDEPLRLGLEHFNRGHFGIAERYFRDAVEKAPKDVTAWVGLAATYDRIGRYDLADRAYASAVKLSGETIELLNNQGYSYMLRGDYPAARKKFLKAYAREPNNPTVLNNLRLLNGSTRAIDRTPDFESVPQ